MLILTLHSVVGSSSRGDTPGKAFMCPFLVPAQSNASARSLSSERSLILDGVEKVLREPPSE